jgi:hypothetical protein
MGRSQACNANHGGRSGNICWRQGYGPARADICLGMRSGPPKPCHLGCQHDLQSRTETWSSEVLGLRVGSRPAASPPTRCVRWLMTEAEAALSSERRPGRLKIGRRPGAQDFIILPQPLWEHAGQ